MQPRIDLITIVTGNFNKMVQFYTEVLGFKVKLELDNYVEFENYGVRFAITANKVMHNATHHESYVKKRSGQSFELAFPVSSTKAVDKFYDELVAKGATAIKAPENMEWNQRTAFFADPDGNIHELFADIG